MVDFGGTGLTSNRFVCPNDRQLALRAKLRTGWSVKTASLGYHQSASSSSQSQQSLDAEEQEAIVNVIKRAEQLDISEQERVGRLVERLENMRRNAIGRSSSQCLLCGDGFGLLRSHKAICTDCKRLVCHKCAIETVPAAAKSHSSSKDRWLCLICAETREIWKKSGAWFFKSLPKYILPAERGGFRNRTRLMRNGRNYREENSSSDEDRNKAWQRRHRRNSSTESTGAGSAAAGGAGAGGQSQIPEHSTQSHQMSDNNSRPILDPPSERSVSPRNELPKGDDSGIEAGKGEGSDSIATSRSLSEWNSSDDRVSPSTSSLSNSTLFKTPNAQATSPPTITLSLTYDPSQSLLHCHLYRCRDLPSTDLQNQADPYCRLDLLPHRRGRGHTRLRTRTAPRTRNPEFQEHLTFYDVGEGELKERRLCVVVLDEDRYGHDYLGEVRVDLGKLVSEETVYLTLPLEDLRMEPKVTLPTPEPNLWYDDLWSRGQILLSLCYSTKRRSLLVTVVRCANLLPMDNNGFSDPYVKLHLKPDPYHRKHKTTIKWKNLNPVYNEEFPFESRPTELATQSLYVTVWDKDYGKSNDYLGGLTIGGVGSKGARLKHWLDMIKYPDHRHEAWHNLTEDPLD